MKLTHSQRRNGYRSETRAAEAMRVRSHKLLRALGKSSRFVGPRADGDDEEIRNVAACIKSLFLNDLRVRRTNIANTWPASNGWTDKWSKIRPRRPPAPWVNSRCQTAAIIYRIMHSCHACAKPVADRGGPRAIGVKRGGRGCRFPFPDPQRANGSAGAGWHCIARISSSCAASARSCRRSVSIYGAKRSRPYQSASRSASSR